MRILGLLCLLCACTGTPEDTPKDTDGAVEETDGLPVDSDPSTETDAPSDTEPPPDTDAPDGAPLEGFGDITGDCGVLDPSLLADSQAHLFRNEVDFGQATFSEDLLSEDAQTVESTPNRGGSSILSEAISMDILYRCELADLLKTETEIDYVDAGGKKTDLLIDVDGIRLGASVTRAFAWPGDVDYELDAAREALGDKLSDALLATANAAPADAWDRQILHVIAWNAQHADVVVQAHGQLEDDVTANTIVMVTVTSGLDGFVYGVED